MLWVYQQPVYGTFWVRESITEITQAWIDSRRNNPTGCSEDSVVPLQSGTKAALSVGRVTSIMWLDRGLLVDVLATFSKGQELASTSEGVLQVTHYRKDKMTVSSGGPHAA